MTNGQMQSRAAESSCHSSFSITTQTTPSKKRYQPVALHQATYALLNVNSDKAALHNIQSESSQTPTSMSQTKRVYESQLATLSGANNQSDNSANTSNDETIMFEELERPMFYKTDEPLSSLTPAVNNIVNDSVSQI